MKKKGLIISTVVMVVVLIASLTTATYAWFTASNRTVISGFDVSVVASNAINIGVKKDNAHKVGAINDDFLSGTVLWVNKTPGELGTAAGEWTEGTPGLSATLNHQINWGAQSKAVGALNGTTNTLSTSTGDYGFIGNGTFNGTQATGKGNTAGSNVYLNAANLDKGTTLSTPAAALANVGATDGEGPQNGDYAYLFLGAAPTKELESNTLYILLDGTASTGTNIGILSAVHVAYRVTKAGAQETTTAWTEVEFFAGKSYSDTLNSATLTWTTEENAAYSTAFDGATAPPSKASLIKIEGLSTSQSAIDQIEIIVYIAGSDADCIDNAKNASGSIKMFFYTVDKATA